MNQLEKEKLITEVISLSMLVNYKTGYCAFVNFSGHVDHMDIRITQSKKNYNDEVATAGVYLDCDGVIERLEEIKVTLIDILESKEVDTAEMDYTIEEIRHYHF